MLAQLKDGWGHDALHGARNGDNHGYRHGDCTIHRIVEGMVPELCKALLGHTHGTTQEPSNELAKALP